MASAAVALDRAFDYVGALICKARGHHCPTPCAEIRPRYPETGHQRCWGLFCCQCCGWSACLPYIVTAAKVVFLPGECGRDEKGESYWKWRTM
jgi:hypothetical protein